MRVIKARQRCWHKSAAISRSQDAFQLEGCLQHIEIFLKITHRGSVVSKNSKVQIIWREKSLPWLHWIGHLYIDQSGAWERMKTRGDVIEGRKGKRRQRRAFRAGWQNSSTVQTGIQSRARVQDDTQRCGKMMLAVFQGWICVCIMCEGAAADIGEGHSICIPIEPGGGPSLSHTPAALTPFLSPHLHHRKQATRADLGTATWTQGVMQNKPAAAQSGLQRAGEGRDGSCKTSTTKTNKTLCCRTEKKLNASPDISYQGPDPSANREGR